MFFLIFAFLFYAEPGFSQTESVVDPESKRLSCILDQLESEKISEILEEENKVKKMHEILRRKTMIEPHWSHSRPIEFEQKMLEMTTSIEKIWGHLGVAFVRDPETVSGLQALPGKETALNRLALASEKKRGKVVFVPNEIYSKLRQAKITKYADGTWTLYLPFESAWKGSPANVSVIHEWIHALYFTARNFSEKRLMSGIRVSSAQGELPFSKQMDYQKNMSFEEWHTHLSDLSLHQKRVTNSPDSAIDFERWIVKIKRLHWMRKRILFVLKKIHLSKVIEIDGNAVFQVRDENTGNYFDLRVMGNQKSAEEKLQQISVSLEKVDLELDLVYRTYQEEILQGFSSNEERQKFVEKITKIYLDLYPI